MKQYILERRQQLPVDVDHAWRFFSDPKNLALITPPELGFRIREHFEDRPMHAGQRIHYTVRPVLGIPLRWTTLIAEVEAPYRFVDTQERGPYARWWHLHTFEANDHGVLMHDRVEYALPLGPLGQFAHGIFVRQQLGKIFDFREATLKRLFPSR